ncbi:MAG: extracellular solute-binding protein [Anaerolineae bacterium]|nr:extracellular solute-binding protein [Anaerolineae bacterium]
MQFLLLIFSLLALLLTGCNSGETAVQLTTPSFSNTEEPTPLLIPTTRPVTVEAPLTTLVIWLPEILAPVADETILELFNTQIQDFVASETNLQVEVRRKRSQDVGGILSTLRSASAVAPGALPDLTLMRREDLLAAVQSNLIQPLEGRITTGVISGLTAHSIELGSLNQELYGMPYMLDVLLVAYQPNAASDLTVRWSFETILKNRLTFVFPAGRSNGVNEVFLLQYLAAGGTPPLDGTMALNEQALQTTLTFYEQAREVGLIDATLLDYTTFTDYEEQLISGTLDTGVVRASTYFRLKAADYPLQVAFIPTASGQPVTQINGWMWVIVTGDSDRQLPAGRLINWLMDASRQEQYARRIGMLPSQLEALRNSSFAGLESEILIELLQNAYIPILENDSGTVLRIIQNALASVLRGDTTAAEATRDAVNQLSG